MKNVCFSSIYSQLAPFSAKVRKNQENQEGFSLKKILSLFLVSILLLAACSSQSKTDGTADGTKSTDEITVWTWDPNFNVKAMKIGEEFYKKEDPNFKLKIIENAQEDIVQKLNTSLSSGTTKGLPNIVLIEDYRAQSFLKGNYSATS